MELGQRSISWRWETGFLLCLILIALALSLIFGPNYSLPGLILSFMLLALIQGVPENAIAITEGSIGCLGQADTLWSFDWDEVESITVSRRGRIKNAELKVTSHRHTEIISYRHYENHLYFELDKKARKALAQYARHDLRRICNAVH